MVKQVQICFGWQLIALLVAIEVLTIPFVALGNNFVGNSKVSIAIMGFIVAFFALIVITRLIRNLLKKTFSKLIGQDILHLKGIIYIGIIAGFLLMFMFYLQEIASNYTRNDYITSFSTTFISVGSSLLIYYTIEKIFHYGIKLKTSNNKYIIKIRLIDILILTLLFSIYEIIAYEVSGIWIPHRDYRFWWGLLSGVGAGFLGSLPVLLITSVTGYKFNLYIDND